MPSTGNVMTGRNGVSYKLGQSLGRGGEGTVYEVEGRNDVVAKIYSDSKLNSHRSFLREKIETMLDQPINAYDNNKILNVAWPQDMLSDSSRVFFGYTMPRVNSKYHIYDVCREIKMSIFPNYNWKISVAIAYNLASAVAKIHKGGVAVGDLNPNNIMVDSRGYITLIDTDSFNIRNKKTGKEYKCTVGMPEVLPPELQVPDLTNEPFNEASDRFSLAIHIFNLLMNDCHPFGCLNMNMNRSSSSLLTVEHNITSGFCPYVNSSHGKPAVTAPDYNMLPSDIRDLFERVFRYDATTAVRSAIINNRPSAAEWSGALFSLIKGDFECCKANSHHVYPKIYAQTHNNCPWCRIDNLLQVQWNKQSNNAGSIANTVNNIISSSSSYTYKYRNSTPLWVACIVIGAVLSPVIWSGMLVEAIEDVFGWSWTGIAAMIILAVTGVISGLFIARFASEHYQNAYNAWPWLLLSLLAPVGAALICGALILIGILLKIVLYILGCIFVLGIICALFSGG